MERERQEGQDQEEEVRGVPVRRRASSLASAESSRPDDGGGPQTYGDKEPKTQKKKYAKIDKIATRAQDLEEEEDRLRGQDGRDVQDVQAVLPSLARVTPSASQQSHQFINDLHLSTSSISFIRL